MELFFERVPVGSKKRSAIVGVDTVSCYFDAVRVSVIIISSGRLRIIQEYFF